MDPGLVRNHNLTITLERAFGTATVNFRYPKALKLSAKSMTDDKWQQHNIQHLGFAAMIITKSPRPVWFAGKLYILRHYANKLLCTFIRHLSHIFDPFVSVFCNVKLYVKVPTLYFKSPKVRTTCISIFFNFN